MDAPVSSVMTQCVFTVDTQDTIEKVEAVMNSHGLSSVPVVDEQNITFGIISAADLVHFHSGKKNPKAVRAWEMCTYKPLEASPDVPIREVAALMVDHHIHHVIVTEHRVVKGFVSSLDLIRHCCLGR